MKALDNSQAEYYRIKYFVDTRTRHAIHLTEIPDLFGFMEENLAEVNLKANGRKVNSILALRYGELLRLKFTYPKQFFLRIKKELNFTHYKGKQPYLTENQCRKVFTYLTYVFNRSQIINKRYLKLVIRNINRKINE